MDSNKQTGWWVGNICNKFEAIFQDVDNLARKEAVKFVTNQVHSVGDNVKRLYSDVVQDLLSPEENLKLQERSETSIQVDTGSHVELDTGTVTKELLVEKGSFNAPKNSGASELINCEYYMTEDNTFEDCINEDVIQATDNTDYNLNLSEAYCKPKNMVASSSLSISEEEELLALVEYMGLSCDNESRSNISTDDGTPYINAPNSTPTLVSVFRDCEEKIPAVGLLLSSDSDADNRALNEDEILWDRFPTEDTRLDVSGQTTELVFPYSSCGDEEADTGDVSSSCSASQKALNINEFVSEDFIEQAKNIFISHVESACTSYAPCSATLAYEIDALDTLPVMELNDPNSFSSSESVSNIAQSQSRDECCHEDAQSKSLSSPSEVMDIPLVIESNDLKSSATSKPVSVAHPYQRPGHCHEDAQSISASSHSERGNSSEFGSGVVDHGMETIDLSDDVKYDGIDLVLNPKFVVPSTHRKRNFGYYKSLIKDALASRKRLSKEYELLGMHHSDIDKESRHNFNPSTVHSVPKSVNELRTESSDMCESDWELL